MLTLMHRGVNHVLFWYAHALCVDGRATVRRLAYDCGPAAWVVEAGSISMLIWRSTNSRNSS